MKKHRRQVLYSGIVTAIGMNNLIDMVHSPHRLWCELFQNWLHVCNFLLAYWLFDKLDEILPILIQSYIMRSLFSTWKWDIMMLQVYFLRIIFCQTIRCICPLESDVSCTVAGKHSMNRPLAWIMHQVPLSVFFNIHWPYCVGRRLLSEVARF